MATKTTENSTTAASTEKKNRGRKCKSERKRNEKCTASQVLC